MPPAPATAQTSSRYNTAADALAALVDAAASAPQMDVAKVKEGKHEGVGARDDEVSPSRGMSLPAGKASLSVYPDGGATSGKDKPPPTKSRIEEELRTLGKTTITAASFIDVIITRQIASEKDSRERGSQSSDSSGSCKWDITHSICCISLTFSVVSECGAKIGEFKCK